MKKITLLVLFFFVQSFTQTLRNPVLEYCTGAWCQWCPCGHSIISQSIMPAIPNAIVIGYHGPANTSSDPWSTFSGNSILSGLGFSAYPTGIVDRTSAPISRSLWQSTLQNRLNIPATVSITIFKTYDPITRNLNVRAFTTPLANLSGTFKINLIITEDRLYYPQTGNSSCPGNSTYEHNHVVRSVINTYTGDVINTDQNWNAGVTLTSEFNYAVPGNIDATHSYLKIIVFKQGTTLNTSEIQQAEKWTLEGNIVPVELSSFTANVVDGSVVVGWETASEINNHGFEIQRSIDGENFATIGFVKGAGTSTQQNAYSFTDNAVDNGNYFYRLKQIDLDGKFEFSNMIEVLVDIPKEFSLEQNYPNPFNPTTKINWQLPVESFVSLKVFDVLGNEVVNLVNETQTAGMHSIDFNAAQLSGSIYFYTLKAGDFSETKKLILLK